MDCPSLPSLFLPFPPATLCVFCGPGLVSFQYGLAVFTSAPGMIMYRFAPKPPPANYSSDDVIENTIGKAV